MLSGGEGTVTGCPTGGGPLLGPFVHDQRLLRRLTSVMVAAPTYNPGRCQTTTLRRALDAEPHRPPPDVAGHNPLATRATVDALSGWQPVVVDIDRVLRVPAEAV